MMDNGKRMEEPCGKMEPADAAQSLGLVTARI